MESSIRVKILLEEILKHVLKINKYNFLIHESNSGRKMDIHDQYLDTQLCDKHLRYSVRISRYSTVISKILILTYFNILDSKAGYLETIQYLDNS